MGNLDMVCDDSPGKVLPSDVISFKEGILSRQALLMSMMFFFGLFFGFTIAILYKVLPKQILDDRVLTTTGAVASVFNGLGRVFWAALSDKVGFKKSYAGVLVIQLAVSATVDLVKGNAALYPIWISAALACEGGHFSMFPPLAVKIFGIQNGG